MSESATGGAGLFWTGHAIVDVGIAGLCAFSKVDRPESLSLAHLDAVADFLEATYYGKKELLGTYLSCVFMNASFVQPSEGADKRTAFIAGYLRAHRAPSDPRVAGTRCVFSGLPATSPLVRTHLPLFSGEGVLNFRPDGQTSVPVAGPFVVAIMFVPLAGRRTEGRMLLVHADDSGLTLEFARRYLDDNRRLLSLALPSERQDVYPEFEREQPMWDATKKRNKFADAKAPRSLVLSDLTTIAARSAGTYSDPTPTALTIYLISNSGQGPSLEIVALPSGVVSFVQKAATRDATRDAWQAVTSAFRPAQQTESEGPAAAKRKKRPPIPGRPGWSRNPAFEELCEVYASGYIDRTAAGKWLRRNLLGRLEWKDSTQYVATRARSWALTDLFLTEVLAMKAPRIEAVRSFADKLADHISRTKDRKLYRSLVFDRLHEVRSALLSAQRRTAAESRVLFGLDEYASVWLHEDGDEFLVRDLITIRVVERLGEAGYFRSNPDDAIEAEAAPAD